MGTFDTSMDMNFSDIFYNVFGLPKIELFDQPFWYWIFIIILALISFVAAHICAKVSFRVLGRLSVKFRLEKNARIRSLFSSSRLIFALLIFMGIDWLVDKPGYSDRTMGFMLKIGLLIGCTLFICHGIEFVFDRIIQKDFGSEKKSKNLAISFAKNVSKALVFGFAFIIFLAFVGVDTKELVVGIGISSLAMAFALKPAVENLFSGALVAFDRSFVIGDFCTVGSVTGTVEDIGIRSIKVRTAQDTLVTIPNVVLARLNIENLSTRRSRKIDVKFSIVAVNNSDIMQAFLSAIRERLNQLDQIESSSNPIVVTGIEDNFLDIHVMASTKGAETKVFLAMRERICLLIIEAVHQHGMTLKRAVQDISFQTNGPLPKSIFGAEDRVENSLLRV